MKWLVAHPGASISTSDVHDGLVAALEARGEQVAKFRLDDRLHGSSSYLTYIWHRGLKKQGVPRPSGADIQYLASQELPYRALRMGVDWVLVVSGMFLHPDALILCHRLGIRVGLILTESPYDDEAQAAIVPYADVVWTNERASVDYLRRFNPETYYLPHAYDAAKHRPDLPVDETVPAHDVVFVGSGFQERIEALAAVDWSGIDLGLYGTWELLGSRHHLRRYVVSRPVRNEYTAQLYRRAKIGLNLYRTSKGFGRDAPRIEHAESLNPRALELAACGVFTVSDYRIEVEEVFGPLVPTFRTPGELERQVRRWLADDEGRGEIAARLPAAVADRSFGAMAESVVAGLREAGRSPVTA